LNVVHAKVQTAYFDTKSRTLTLPIWTDMNGDLYDLLCGHEVGHALETPEKGWHDAVVPGGDMKKIDHALKGYLNVLEDCRIEKKIKNRYPGLRVNFYRAYQGLHEKNFFQARGKDLNQYGLIDRINLHFKVGFSCGVKFTKEERVFLTAAENAETVEDVYDLALRIYDYAADEKNKKQEEQGNDIEFGEGDSDEFGDEEYDFDFDDDMVEEEDADDADLPPMDVVSMRRRTKKKQMMKTLLLLLRRRTGSMRRFRRTPTLMAGTSSISNQRTTMSRSSLGTKIL
jgi:hypothetical protein